MTTSCDLPPDPTLPDPAPTGGLDVFAGEGAVVWRMAGMGLDAAHGPVALNVWGLDGDRADPSDVSATLEIDLSVVRFALERSGSVGSSVVPPGPGVVECLLGTSVPPLPGRWRDGSGVLVHCVSDALARAVVDGGPAAVGGARDAEGRSLVGVVAGRICAVLTQVAGDPGAVGRGRRLREVGALWVLAALVFECFGAVTDADERALVEARVLSRTAAQGVGVLGGVRTALTELPPVLRAVLDRRELTAAGAPDDTTEPARGSARRL